MRSPIHLGSGEPVLLLHPFLMSQTVWEKVAEQLADTGRFEVFAPTMAAHNGGPASGTWFLSSAVLADHVERELDELGWDTAHIVGNSLGGWVAFELERRGRARSVTGIAPAGGWTRWSPVKFEVISKFIAGMPILAAAHLLGQRALRLPFSRLLATLPISGSPDGVSERELSGVVDDAAHCPAYFQLLLKALLLPGLQELEHTAAPSHLVLCEKDRVVPPKDSAGISPTTYRPATGSPCSTASVTYRCSRRRDVSPRSSSTSSTSAARRPGPSSHRPANRASC